MLSKEEQLIQLLANHKAKLLLTKNEINGDLFGSLLAWGFFLKNFMAEPASSPACRQGRETESGNNPTLFIPRYKELKKIYPFLPEYESVIEDISGVRDFILSFNVKENDIKNVRWKKENQHLDIIITPENGSIDPRDFSFIPAKFRYDLLLILGTTDFGELGKTYERNSDLFFELPIVNLDIDPGNENYGQLNLVNPVPSSLAEFSADLMLKINEESVKNEVAQCLLTALVESTDNLKSSKVTPHTFEIASLLMERGGNHQQILSALYDTESLASLKLWGRLLERLKEEDNLIWSYIDKQELEKFELPDIMLRRFFVRLKNFIELSNKKLLVLWQDNEDKIQAFLYKVSKENEKDKGLMQKLGGELFNNEILQFALENKNQENFTDLVQKIKSELSA
ncbi:MAG: hypothetical protein V1690_03635 [Candidatus Moraniibacteriota bacterium]